ncbi:hypothetical protein CAC42_7894 [Sphaceloma murrayae]|uniref:Ubiquitin-like domain-containing protein n=1 Tax=Sphaceloma murrayae TaxID=2082308 RepID=A0A2K1QY16_9PEZI|nr:hypothetical protein CAC42_7894 [Sphaceloma murrayae]
MAPITFFERQQGPGLTARDGKITSPPDAKIDAPKNAAASSTLSSQRAKSSATDNAADLQPYSPATFRWNEAAKQAALKTFQANAEKAGAISQRQENNNPAHRVGTNSDHRAASGASPVKTEDYQSFIKAVESTRASKGHEHGLGIHTDNAEYHASAGSQPFGAIQASVESTADGASNDVVTPGTWSQSAPFRERTTSNPDTSNERGLLTASGTLGMTEVGDQPTQQTESTTTSHDAVESPDTAHLCDTNGSKTDCLSALLEKYGVSQTTAEVTLQVFQSQNALLHEIIKNLVHTVNDLLVRVETLEKTSATTSMGNSPMSKAAVIIASKPVNASEPDTINQHEPVSINTTKLESINGSRQIVNEPGHRQASPMASGKRGADPGQGQPLPECDREPLQDSQFKVQENGGDTMGVLPRGIKDAETLAGAASVIDNDVFARGSPEITSVPCPARNIISSSAPGAELVANDDALAWSSPKATNVTGVARKKMTFPARSVSAATASVASPISSFARIHEAISTSSEADAESEFPRGPGTFRVNVNMGAGVRVNIPVTNDMKIMHVILSACKKAGMTPEKLELTQGGEDFSHAWTVGECDLAEGDVVDLEP